MTDLSLLPISDPAVWQAALADQPASTAFHRWDFLASISSELACEFHPLGVFEGDELVGLFPLMTRRRGPFAIVNWLPFPYLGPLVPADLLGATLDALRVFEKDHRAAITQIAVPPLAPDATASRKAIPARFEATDEDTCIIELDGRTSEELLKACSRRVRRSLEKARKAGAESRRLTRSDIVDFVPGIMEETFGAHGRPSDTPPSALLAVWDALEPTGDIAGHAVVIDGELAAFDVNINWNGTSYAWIAGGLRKFRDAQPMTLVTWDAISYSIDQSVSKYDMVGTPTPAITEFKLSFDARIRGYTTARSVNSKAYLVAQRAHNALTLTKHRLSSRLQRD